MVIWQIYRIMVIYHLHYPNELQISPLTNFNEIMSDTTFESRDTLLTDTFIKLKYKKLTGKVVSISKNF